MINRIAESKIKMFRNIIKCNTQKKMFMKEFVEASKLKSAKYLTESINFKF